MRICGSSEEGVHINKVVTQMNLDRTRLRVLTTLRQQPQQHLFIRESEDKGLGMFARKKFQSDEVVAYYRCEVINVSHHSDSDDTYRMALPTWLQHHLQSVGVPVGYIACDILSIPKDVPPPLNGVPYWGFIINEPSPDETVNVYTDDQAQEVCVHIDTKQVTAQNIINKIQCVKDWEHLFSQHTIYITYVFRAETAIQKGEEILWYYGDTYDRDYAIYNVYTRPQT